MDITEAFRSEDLTKTDFFDFVVTPDVSDTQTLQQFSKQMRTVNAFLGNANNDLDIKETNNNMLTTTQIADVPTTTTESTPNYDPNFWSDKETVRLETAILEDLNKYCWSPDQDGTSNKLISNNTDGHIYTLTVLNGVDQSATWYRPPLTAIIKEEDGSISSPSPMETIQSGLDIDSIFSIIPSQLNGFGGNYSEHALSPNTDGLIKSETFTYEDSGYADNKDEFGSSLIIDTPLLEAHDSFNNNNNDWKLNNNNNGAGTADSLLRSALQGKAFVRYNGGGAATTAAANKTVIKVEPNSELRRVLSTPPGKSEAPLFIVEKESKGSIITGVEPAEGVLFDEGSATAAAAAAAAAVASRITDSDNPSSTHSVEDMLLSHLDSASYPEDYEKLKLIANEVAESVQQFCQIDPVENAIFSISPDQIGILNNLNSSIINAPVVTSTKPQTKKYKRSNSGTKQTTVQNATSTSNGVRKERSLHYCSICSKGFKDKYSVNVHIRTHTGEKPFACSLCGKSFRQKAHLAKHYQTHIAQKNAATAGNVATAKAKSR